MVLCLLRIFSNTAQAVVPAMPAAPTNFTATNEANQGNRRRVNLTWSHAGGNVTGFRIERSTDNLNWTLVTTTGVAARTFTVTGLTRNTNYYFQIRANNGAIIFSTWVSVGPILTNP